MNFPTFTLTRTLGDRSLVAPGSLDAERLSKQINAVEIETGSCNIRVFAFDKGKSTLHGAADKRIGGSSTRSELVTVQTT